MSSERRHVPQLTEEQIDEIAERAAEKAIEKMTTSVYRQIGKSIVEKVVYAAGASVVALSIYLAAKGIK